MENKKEDGDLNAPKKAEIKSGAKLDMGYYRLFMFLTSAVRIFFNGRARLSQAFEKQKKEGAMLILCNHVSSLDFVHMTPPMRGAKVNFVVAEHMKYSQPVFAKLITGYGAIQKKAFYADFQCIKAIKQNLDAGISVILCPEGKVSSYGVTGEITLSAARLVKWLGYPVASMVIKGAGLVRPKWARNTRRGRVITECDMLFTAEDVKKLSKEELLIKIRAALAHNEHLFQRENNLSYRGGGLAEGLENLLYRCPKCGREFKMYSGDSFIKCGVCGNSAYYTKTGELLPLTDGDVCPERIDLWYNDQREALRSEINNGTLDLSYPVELYIENERRNGYRSVTIGTLGMDAEKIVFAPDSLNASENSEDPLEGLKMPDERPNTDASNVDKGTSSGKADGSARTCENASNKPEDFARIRLTFPLKNYSAITNIPGSSVNIYDETHVYRFKFLAEQASEKYAIAAEILGEMREKQS